MGKQMRVSILFGHPLLSVVFHRTYAENDHTINDG